MFAAKPRLPFFVFTGAAGAQSRHVLILGPTRTFQPGLQSGPWRPSRKQAREQDHTHTSRSVPSFSAQVGTDRVAANPMPTPRSLHSRPGAPMSTSTYFWREDCGQQSDGCKQGDVLPPAMYSPAQHDALAAAQSRLESGSVSSQLQLAPYLRLTTSLACTVEQHAGVASNLANTPPGIETLGPGVWCRCDNEPATRGFVALCLQIGHTELVQRILTARLKVERLLLQELVIYGAFRHGEALGCDVTLVSPLCTDGRLQPMSRGSANNALPGAAPRPTTPGGAGCGGRTLWAGGARPCPRQQSLQCGMNRCLGRAPPRRRACRARTPRLTVRPFRRQVAHCSSCRPRARPRLSSRPGPASPSLAAPAATCSCTMPLWACPRSGVLRARGGPLERAAARVCREAGAAVATHVLVRNLNLHAHRHDERRIEVIGGEARNWPLTLRWSRRLLLPVCPGAGEAAPLEQRWLKHAGQTSVPTLSSPTPVGATWLCSVLKSVVAGVPKLPPSSLGCAGAGAQCRRDPARCLCCRRCHPVVWTSFHNCRCRCQLHVFFSSPTPPTLMAKHLS